MKKFLFVGILFSLALMAFSCEFTFEVESQTVLIGSEFYVRVELHQTHRRCVLDSLEEDIHFEGEGLAILGKTAWTPLSSDVYEAWLKVIPTEAGDGWIKVWKDCSKNGYEEEVFPIQVVR